MTTVLRQLAPRDLLLGSVAAIFVIGIVDWATGPEYASSIFYLLPIAAATWYASRDAGIAMALLSALVWVAADVLSGANYHSELVPYWNTGVRLGFFLITLFLMDAYRRKLREAEALALADPLTGAANRRAFYLFVERLLPVAERRGEPISLVYIDLDNFKLLNDRQGHAAGDRALQAVAEGLGREVRRSDIVARLGGDEFALALPGAGEADVRRLVERVNAALLARMRKEGWPVTFSIGVATFLKPADFGDMLRRADALMYEVKAGGKNSVRHEVI